MLELADALVELKTNPDAHAVVERALLDLANSRVRDEVKARLVVNTVLVRLYTGDHTRDLEEMQASNNPTARARGFLKSAVVRDAVDKAQRLPAGLRITPERDLRQAERAYRWVMETVISTLTPQQQAHIAMGLAMREPGFDKEAAADREGVEVNTLQARASRARAALVKRILEHEQAALTEWEEVRAAAALVIVRSWKENAGAVRNAPLVRPGSKEES